MRDTYTRLMCGCDNDALSVAEIKLRARSCNEWQSARQLFKGTSWMINVYPITIGISLINKQKYCERVELINRRTKQKKLNINMF